MFSTFSIIVGKIVPRAHGSVWSVQIIKRAVSSGSSPLSLGDLHLETQVQRERERGRGMLEGCGRGEGLAAGAPSGT